MRRFVTRASQHGIALLLVLWACTLLAIVLGGYAVMARTEGLQAHYVFAQTRAHYAAEAGLMRAIYALQLPDSSNRWMANGHPYHFRFNDARVSVTILDDNGKVDLNAAGRSVLKGLFLAAGESQDQAKALAKAVVDWRTYLVNPLKKAQDRAVYRAAGRNYGPRHGPFASVPELQMVLGMTPALYAKVAPLLTIWSGRSRPDLNLAPSLVLAALPGMTPDRVRDILAERAMSSGQGATPVDFGRPVRSIRSVATLTDGTSAVLRATVRMRTSLPPRRQGFIVFRWQEGRGK